MLRRFAIIRLVVFGMLLAVAGSPGAQETSTLGPVTNLPLPRFVSLKVDDGYVRRGPSQSHRIDWILTRKGTPLLVTAEFENWRRVQDEDGAGGWMHYALLSGHRTIVVRAQRAPVRKKPAESAAVVALVEKGVIASLGACTIDWCEIEVDKIDGWIRKSEIWGVSATEIRE